MSTCPIPCLESSPTPSHMPKPIVRLTYIFQNKRFLFSKTYYRVSVKYVGQPSEANCWVILQNSHGSASEMNCWITLQKILRKIFLEIHFTTIFIFLSFSFMSCTLNCHYRMPRCIWNALCHFQTIHANIFYMHILTKLTHINHIIQFIAITSKLAHMA